MENTIEVTSQEIVPKDRLYHLSPHVEDVVPFQDQIVRAIESRLIHGYPWQPKRHKTEIDKASIYFSGQSLRCLKPNQLEDIANALWLGSRQIMRNHHLAPGEEFEMRLNPYTYNCVFAEELEHLLAVPADIPARIAIIFVGDRNLDIEGVLDYDPSLVDDYAQAKIALASYCISSEDANIARSAAYSTGNKRFIDEVNAIIEEKRKHKYSDKRDWRMVT